MSAIWDLLSAKQSQQLTGLCPVAVPAAVVQNILEEQLGNSIVMGAPAKLPEQVFILLQQPAQLLRLYPAQGPAPHRQPVFSLGLGQLQLSLRPIQIVQGGQPGVEGGQTAAGQAEARAVGLQRRLPLDLPLQLPPQGGGHGQRPLRWAQEQQVIPSGKEGI